jgi:hypothetical protein
MTIYGFTAADQDLETFYREKASRTLKYLELSRHVFAAEHDYLEEATTLRRRGLLKMRGFFPRGEILGVGAKVEDFVAGRQCLGRIRNHAAESPEGIQRGEFSYYTVEEMRAPGFSLRAKVSSVGIVEPLIQLPELAGLVFDPRLLGIVSSYFGTIPVLSFVKVRTTFANDLPTADTQWFHADFGSYRILKAFIYLNDVDLEGGPFCYIEGSHAKKFGGWTEKSRFADDELREHYGPDCVTACTARAGDIYLAETTGFHRGLKPTRTDRNIVIVTYCVHPEYGFSYEPNRMARSTFDNLTDVGRAASDALEIEDEPGSTS